MKKGLTELIYIIDKSASMRGLEADTIGGFNAMLQEQQAAEGEAVVTTALFDARFELLHDRINVKAIAPLTGEDYKIGRGTAMLDAIGLAMHMIRKAQQHTREEYRPEKTLFVIITDGEENHSRKYTAKMIRERIERRRKKYNWEFLFFGANIDAVSVAGKLGIDTAHVRDFRTDSQGIQAAYSTMSALSTSFRMSGPAREKLPRIRYPHYTTGDAQDWTYEYTWEDMEAFDSSKNPLFSETPKELRNEVYHKVFPYFIEHPGKLLEGGHFQNATLDNVKLFLQVEYCYPEPPRTLDDLTIRKHWSEAAVFTDSWQDAEGKAVPLEELLPGELSAEVREVGCYTVRSAQRVYRVNQDHSETPASEKELENYRKNQWEADFDGWLDNLRLVHEISAKHHDGPEREFILVTGAKNAHACYWTESINAVYTVKENASVPDEHASLFVNKFWIGSCNSLDYWYKLDPTGRMWGLSLNGFFNNDDDNNDDTQFCIMREPKEIYAMTYVLSDIHGNQKAFDSILEQIDLQPDDDLYILGDVIDRHPHGIALLQRIMSMPNVHMLLGNHEYMMLRALGFPYDGPEDVAGEDPADLREIWYYNGGKVTHKAWKRLPKDMQAEIVDYLRNLPLNYELKVGGELFKLIHAAPEELYDLVGDPEESKTFFCVWDRDAIMQPDALEAVTVVFGHTPTAHFHEASPLEIFRRGKLVGIDCGAGWPEGYGGRLACVRLDDMEVFYSCSKSPNPSSRKTLSQ